MREAEASAKREVAAAWESYQAEGDLEHIITVLTSAAAHYAPLGAEFAQEIARLLGKRREFVDPHDTRTDDPTPPPECPSKTRFVANTS